MRSLGLRSMVLPALVLALLAVTSARAQSASTGETPSAGQPRPRIGVALGGGAARGFAHVGILRWFDEHRIPIDVIAGTSMGGLIGGAAATGLSPDDTWALLRTVDWGSVLAPDAPFRDKTFRRKEDARAFPSMLTFGLKHGFDLPSGFSPAEQVALFLDRMTLSYHGVTDFSTLPIPFACVAADLITSEAVVLDHGRLEQALRATMAIPGVFTPVRVDGRVFVDGGILNNVPADVVRDMGADIIIAVDVARDVHRIKRSDTLFRVLTETLDVVTRAPARRALASANIVIEPKLGELTALDFGHVDEFVRYGYEAAESKRAVLERYALGPAEYQAHINARRARRLDVAVAPTELMITGTRGAPAEVVRRQLLRHLGHPLNIPALERDLTLLTGSGRFDTLTYRVEVDGPRQVLKVEAREKEHSPPFVQLALDLQNAESPTVVAALRGRLTFFDVLTPRSETRVDVGLGRTVHVGAEWALALGSHGLFVAPRASFTRQHENLFAGDHFSGEYRRETVATGIDMGFTTGRSLELRAGYARERVDGSVTLGQQLLPEVDGTQGYWRAQAVFDTQNGPVLPTGGLYLETMVRRFTTTARLKDPSTENAFHEPSDMMQVQSGGSYFVTVGRHGRAFTAGGVGWSFHDTATLNAFTLGGPLALSALRAETLRGSNYALGEAGYFHELARMVEGALGHLYAGAWVEAGTAFERASDAKLRTNISTGLVLETVIGPAFLIGSVGTDGKTRFYLGLGRLFNR